MGLPKKRCLLRVFVWTQKMLNTSQTQDFDIFGRVINNDTLIIFGRVINNDTLLE